jgi:hypothetical protein
MATAAVASSANAPNRVVDSAPAGVDDSLNRVCAPESGFSCTEPEAAMAATDTAAREIASAASSLGFPSSPVGAVESRVLDAGDDVLKMDLPADSDTFKKKEARIKDKRFAHQRLRGVSVDLAGDGLGARGETMSFWKKRLNRAIGVDIGAALRGPLSGSGDGEARGVRRPFDALVSSSKLECARGRSVCSLSASVMVICDQDSSSVVIRD